jgi:general secretion pathway protein C
MSVPAALRDLQSLSAQQWLDRATRTLPQALSVVLVIAIAWQLVQMLWLALEPEPTGDSAPIVASSTAPSRPKGVDIQAIVNAKLFGAPAASVATGPAPETQLPLVLSAVFAADQPNKGLAIIGESAQQTKVYKAGDSIRSGTKLHEVYADRVLLERGGKLETLALPRRSATPITASRPAAPPPAQMPNRTVQDLRQAVESNPTALTEIIRPQPVFANGVQRGYRVYPGRNRQQFSKLGLQPGDLVLAINGTPLDDPQRGMEIFNTIGASGEVMVTVERNGQSQELTLNTAQLYVPESPSGQAPGDKGSDSNRGTGNVRGSPPNFSQKAETQ